MMSLDIAFPRNEKNWFEKLPKDIDDMLEMKLYYGHLFCHVLHQNYIVKKGIDGEKLKNKLLKLYDKRGLNIQQNIMLAMNIQQNRH